MKFEELLRRFDRVAWASEVFGVRLAVPLPRRIPRRLRSGDRRRSWLSRFARWGFGITWDLDPGLPEARVVRGVGRRQAKPEMPRELAAWTAGKVVGVLEARAEHYLEAEKARILTAHEVWRAAHELNIAMELSLVTRDVAADSLDRFNRWYARAQGGTKP